MNTLTRICLIQLVVWQACVTCHAGVGPNMVEKVGTTGVQMNCDVRDEVYRWYKMVYDENTRTTTKNFDCGNVNIEFWPLEPGRGGHQDMNFSALTLDHGATYKCEHPFTDPDPSVYLVVLESDPNCSTYPDLSDLAEGDNVNLTCYVKYGYNGSPEEQLEFRPRMTWTGPQVPEQIDESVALVSRYSIIVPVTTDTHGDSFSCNTFIKPPTAQQIQDQLSSNTPFYTHSWTSEPFNVQYSPKNIELTPVVDPPGSYPARTEMTCSADGNPDPTYEWINTMDNSTTQGDTFTVPSENTGGHNVYLFSCLASNDFRNQIHTIKKDFIVYF